MNVLANRGFVFSTAATATNFYYVIPEPLMDGLVLALEEDLALATFEHDDMRVTESSAFCPPLEFSVTSLATYIDQNGPRLTRRQRFIAMTKRKWTGSSLKYGPRDSELFKFHLDFLMSRTGEADELRESDGACRRICDVPEEWLGLESEDHTADLIFLERSGTVDTRWASGSFRPCILREGLGPRASPCSIVPTLETW